MPNKQNQYVHVVGTLNTTEKTGQFLYVTPTKLATTQTTEGAAHSNASTEVELVILKQDGTEISRIPISLMRASDVDDGADAMVDELIPVYPDMAQLQLIYQGDDIAAYSAGQSAPPAAAGLSLGIDPPGSGNKRPMSLDATYTAEPGVTYTVQVRPNEERLWQTIAIGLTVPDTVLDRNQFPDAEKADIRVIRTNGFTDAIVAEDTVDLQD